MTSLELLNSEEPADKDGLIEAVEGAAETNPASVCYYNHVFHLFC